MIRLDALIEEITLWIDNNITLPLSIEDVAVRSGYSRWHLQRVFQRIKGKPLATYIRDKKLDLAAQALIKGQESVVDIGFRYGFDSQQSFTRCFSKKYAIPPQKYRLLYTDKHR